MYRYISLAIVSMLPLVTLADMGMEEGDGMGHQMQELLPFVHFGEGHSFSGVLSIVLWIFAIYGVYALVKKFTGSKGPTTGPTA